MQQEEEPHSEFEKTYSAFVDDLEKLFNQVIELQKSSITSILNLSAGSLVATITLIQVFGQDYSVGVFLLPTSWLFFCIAIISCLLHLINRSDYLNIIMFFKTYRKTAIEAVSKHDVNLTDEDKIRIVVDISKIHLEKDPELKFLNYSVITAFISFVLGLICLGMFASLNLPW